MPVESTPVERLLALFNTRTRKGCIRPVQERNNGMSQFAQKSGIDIAVLSRWRHGKASVPAGRIPTSYNQRIIETCDREGISRTNLIGILDPHRCEACGKTLTGGEE